jgi:exopolysaccharide production protein ExoZ
MVVHEGGEIDRMSRTGSVRFVEVEAVRVTAPASTTVQKNSSMQSLRGLAALFVALYHASVYAGRQFGDAGWATMFDGRFGLVGVAIFFAISGLLMAELIQRTDPWRFLAHRMVRIYPTYLLAVLVSMSIIGLLGIRKIGLHALSLLLVPVGQREYYLGVEWTLVFECTYYVALFLVAAAGLQRHLNVITLGWLGLIGAAALVVGRDNILYPVYSIWLAPANIAFACGLLIPWISRHLRIPIGTGVLAVVALMVAVPPDPVIARCAGGIAAALLVLDAIRVKVPPRVMLGLPTLGDWSYALYLVHVPCVLIVYHFWPAPATVGAAWLAAVATAIAVSAGVGTADVWMYRRLKDAVDVLSETDRRWRVNAYACVFIIASLIGLIIT